MWVNGAVTVVIAGYFCIASVAHASSAFFMLPQNCRKVMEEGAWGGVEAEALNCWEEIWEGRK